MVEDFRALQEAFNIAAYAQAAGGTLRARAVSGDGSAVKTAAQCGWGDGYVGYGFWRRDSPVGVFTGSVIGHDSKRVGAVLTHG